MFILRLLLHPSTTGITATSMTSPNPNPICWNSGCSRITKQPSVTRSPGSRRTWRALETLRRHHGMVQRRGTQNRAPARQSPVCDVCPLSHPLLLDEPDDQELIAAHQTYFGTALREQRKAVAEVTIHNADAICFAAIMILIDSITTMRRPSLEPYAPPMEWLQLGKGARSVFGFVTQIERIRETRVMSLVAAQPAIPLHDNEVWSTE
ncbi:hypothetical protein VTN77DRAFT_7370 [Rasamsonia byssochlamydoides]|uniref:uncharacterized protein n=1 Tax=Rasamsonia byssochlamydoides TaxID=89139 RepID=UPI003744586B